MSTGRSLAPGGHKATHRATLLTRTVPALGLMGVDLQLGELLDNTDQLHEERLMEQSHLAIVRPQTISTRRDALIAANMLHTLEYLLHRQLKIFNSKALADAVRKELTKTSEVPVTKRELQNMRRQLKKDEILVKLVQKQMRNRIAWLKGIEDKAAESDLEKLIEGHEKHECRLIKQNFLRARKHGEIELVKEVDVATMPKRIHMIAQEHSKISDGIDGRLYQRSTGCFAPLVRRLKRYCYFSYCVTDMGSLKTRMTRSQLTRCKHVSLCLALFYLFACTFYIFLYAIQVADNEVINSILLTVAISNGTEIIVTGPVIMFLTAGLIPWLAVGLVANDVRRKLAQDKNAFRQAFANSASPGKIEFEILDHNSNPMFMANLPRRHIEMVEISPNSEAETGEILQVDVVKPTDKPLPEPWEEHYDPDSGRPYYLNSVTEEVTWEPPQTGLPVGASSDDSRHVLDLDDFYAGAADLKLDDVYAGAAESDDDHTLELGEVYHQDDYSQWGVINPMLTTEYVSEECSTNAARRDRRSSNRSTVSAARGTQQLERVQGGWMWFDDGDEPGWCRIKWAQTLQANNGWHVVWADGSESLNHHDAQPKDPLEAARGLCLKTGNVWYKPPAPPAERRRKKQSDQHSNSATEEVTREPPQTGLPVGASSDDSRHVLDLDDFYAGAADLKLDGAYTGAAESDDDHTLELGEIYHQDDDSQWGVINPMVKASDPESFLQASTFTM